MGDTWADYLISKVRYDDEARHVDRVLVHPDNGATVGAGTEMAREQVVALLGHDVTFMTICRALGSRRWSPGAAVRLVTIDGTGYIRTDADQTRADELGELPRL